MRAAFAGVILLVCGAAVISASAAKALSAADKCEAAKLKIAGKYEFCRLKAESKAVKIGGSPDYSLCDSRYGSKWSNAETSGAGQCPSNGDQAGIQGFITQHTDDVAVALAGGPLPDCPADLAMCTGDLSTCNGSLGICNGNLTTCTTNLSATTASLTTCTSNLGICNGDLSTCNTNLIGTTASLASCNTNLASTTASLTTCNSNYATCSADLSTVNAGTAAQADVLSGKTFSSSSGLGQTGTMANVGQQNVTPGISPVSITQGYHDGTGTVAGDADLVAGNIKNGVSIFGVSGTVRPAQLLRTGQTQCDQGGGTFGPCPGSPTGQDASALKGVTRSYTDNGDGTITDNQTGLMWEKLSEDATIHSHNTTFSWYNAFNVKIATLNSGSGFAGYTDWRLPNRLELESLMNFGLVPVIDPVFNTGCIPGCTVLTCSCTTASFYWSSTSVQTNAANAWTMSFFDGNIDASNKASLDNARAVRGGL